MGWGRWMLLGDLGLHLDDLDQRTEIDGLKRQLRWRRQAAASMEKRLRRVQEENDELKLYLASVLRLLTAKGIANPEEIRAMVAAIDREDGTDDGRYTGRLQPGPPPG